MKIILYCFIFIVGYELGQKENRLCSCERDCINLIRKIPRCQVRELQIKCGLDSDGLLGKQTLQVIFDIVKEYFKTHDKYIKRELEE